MALIGLSIAAPTFLVFHDFGAPALAGGTVVEPLLLTQAQTAAFWAVLLVHFGLVMSARSVDRSAFTFSPLSNPWLLGGIAVSIAVRLLPTFVPSIGGLFRTAAFPVDGWPWILPCLLPGFLVLELDKLIGVRSRKPRTGQASPKPRPRVGERLPSAIQVVSAKMPSVHSSPEAGTHPSPGMQKSIVVLPRISIQS